MKKACAYIRVSTDYQTEYSPDSQLKLIKQYAQAHHFFLEKHFIFKDEGISGRSADKRPAFKEMMKEAKKKSFDVILIYNSSRFARNHEESIIYRAMLKRLNIELVSITQPNSDPKTDLLLHAIYSVMDEMYSIELSENVKRGMLEKASRGEHLGALPYGYRLLDATKTPIIISEEAKLVRLMFESFQRGKSPAQIANGLNAKGIQTRRGNPWAARSVRYVLNNPFYAGQLLWNRKTNNELRPKAEWIQTKGMHESIIPLSLFQDVQKQLQKSPQKNKKATSNCSHWLSGMVKCSVCGRSLVLNTTVNKQRRYFRCNGYIKGKCKVSQNISCALLETVILQNFSWLDQWTAKQQITLLNMEQLMQEEQKEIFHQKKKLDEQLKRLQKAYLNGIDTLEEYKKQKLIVFSKMQTLKQKYSALTHSQHKENQQMQTIDQIFTSPELSMQLKNTVLRSFVEKLVFDKKKQRLSIYFCLQRP